MSFWGNLFGSGDAIKSVVDNVASGLDKLVYTDEEKSDAAAKERTEARGMVVQWMQATQGQNLARRLISLAITAVWLGFYVLSALVYSASIFITDGTKAVELSQFLTSQSQGMNDAVMLILAFYFAAPHMGGIVEALLGRKANMTDRKG